MATISGFILLIIVLALVFDFVNGFHDAANSIATIVTTGVLTPRQAVIWAAFFNFIAFAIFNLSVAKTIGNGLIDPSAVDNLLIFGALTGALAINLITWYFGLPSSSSHALIGGLAGCALYTAGLSALKVAGLSKVFAGIVVVPLAGIVAGFLAVHIIQFTANRVPEKNTGRLFTGLQLVSSALLSLSHGGNDAQKTMGIIAVILFTNDLIGDAFYVPFWVILSCQTVISLGTLAGGWRIVETMGKRITNIDRKSGSAAEAAAATMIFIATQSGVPVSTTHTVTGAITGTGLSRGRSEVQWPMLRRIFFSWLLVIPASGLAGIVFYRIAQCLAL